MAMRYYVDKRTLITVAKEANLNYTHGLPGTPDTVDVRFLASLASTTNFIGICAVADVTGVTIQNCGATTSPQMEVVAMCLHSIIQ